MNNNYDLVDSHSSEEENDIDSSEAIIQTTPLTSAPPSKSEAIKNPAPLNNNNDLEDSDISEEENESGKSWSGVSEFAVIVQCI